MAGGSRRAAFFDVDETVITVKSMFDFLRHWTEYTGGGPQAYQEAAGRLHAIAAAGRHRSEVNRAYYRGFAGVPYEELLEQGRQWYAVYRRRPDAFVGATLDAIAAHRLTGDPVVFVSGSFRACLEPLAGELGADLVLGSEPLVGSDGRLTGEVVRPMIGSNKALAVQETVARLGLTAAHCYCYGDHASDLDMLQQVGRPHVVGQDPVLLAQAAEHGWPLLSAEPGPLPELAGRG
ncbi:HAD-IB family hydrolase [Kitasatospora sp. NBC_01287]|uniref:HAD family hydrolase n=1 Tax=Kitasatospora sp. NBC_01287 TaxID=2903573 RepID=UPI00224ECE95|nr:HAD family hydrolase [Kitasatospora sp. NBC_01287]MCX4746057.1 HAD-IB family hydrolase [Kitasatospora sp. NBC_01287]